MSGTRQRSSVTKLLRTGQSLSSLWNFHLYLPRCTSHQLQLSPKKHITCGHRRNSWNPRNHEHSQSPQSSRCRRNDCSRCQRGIFSRLQSDFLLVILSVFTVIGWDKSTDSRNAGIFSTLDLYLLASGQGVHRTESQGGEMCTERDFPGGPVVKNQPASAGTQVQSLIGELLSLMPWGQLSTPRLEGLSATVKTQHRQKRKKNVHRETQISAEGPLLACSWVLVSTYVWGNHPGKGNYLSKGLNPVVLMQGTFQTFKKK